MSKRIKTKTINIIQNKTIFSSFIGFREKKESEISELRQLLSNEKSRILHVLKTDKPNSIYELSKIL